MPVPDSRLARLFLAAALVGILIIGGIVVGSRLGLREDASPSSPPPSSVASPSPSTTPQVTETLGAGPRTSTVFGIPVAYTIPGSGWTLNESSERLYLGLDSGEVPSEITIYLVSEVYEDPCELPGGATRPISQQPEALLAWAATVPQLRLTTPSGARIGTRSASEVVATVGSSSSCARPLARELWPAWPDGGRILAAEAQRWFVLSIDDRLVVVIVTMPAGRLDAIYPLLEPVVQSLSFG